MKYKKYYQICIVGAICEGGWVGVEYKDNYGDIEEKLSMSERGGIYKYGSIMYFKAQDEKQGDPHLNFNTALFAEYFREQLIPSLEQSESTSLGTFLIMDQCSYHTATQEGSFNPRKASRSARSIMKGSKNRDY